MFRTSSCSVTTHTYRVIPVNPLGEKYSRTTLHFLKLQDLELIDEPREFTVEELFFSATDLKGRIQRANDVFRRISGYSWNELQNKPHNIVRHPDMPRIVFQLLWEHIEAGKPIVAYVKNLAHDRRYYWVVALVVKIPNGYLSVRFKPGSPLLPAVKRLYSELRSAEAAIENDTKDRKAAMASSRTLLETSLRTLGFPGYDEFMQEVLKREMQNREEKLSHLVSRAPPADSTAGSPRELASLRTAAAMLDRLLEILNVMFRDLERYAIINRGVREKSDNVTEISESLRVLALNGIVEADRLGKQATGVRPVLDWLRSFSRENTRAGALLSASLVELVHDVDLVVFRLSAARLQIEMTARFAHELAELAAGGGLRQSLDQFTEGTIACLHASSCQTVREALAHLSDVRNKLKGLTAAQARFEPFSPAHLSERKNRNGRGRRGPAGVGIRRRERAVGRNHGEPQRTPGSSGGVGESSDARSDSWHAGRGKYRPGRFATGRHFAFLGGALRSGRRPRIVFK